MPIRPVSLSIAMQNLIILTRAFSTQLPKHTPKPRCVSAFSARGVFEISIDLYQLRRTSWERFYNHVPLQADVQCNSHCSTHMEYYDIRKSHFMYTYYIRDILFLLTIFCISYTFSIGHLR